MPGWFGVGVLRPPAGSVVTMGVIPVPLGSGCWRCRRGAGDAAMQALIFGGAPGTGVHVGQGHPTTPGGLGRTWNT